MNEQKNGQADRQTIDRSARNTVEEPQHRSF